MTLNKNNTIYLLLFALLVCSCIDKQEDNNIKKIKNFPIVSTLSPIQESSEDIFNFAYYDVKLIDKYIAVVEKKSDKAVKFLDKESLESLFFKIPIGNGPNEISLAGFIKVSGDRLTIVDELKSRVFIYDINDLNRENLFVPRNKFKFSKVTMSDALVLDSNNIFITGKIDSGLVGVYNSKGEFKRAVGSIPNNYPKGYTNLAYFNYYHNFKMEFFPDKEKFIVYSRYNDKLQVFNVKGGEILKMAGPDLIEPEYIARNNQLSIVNESDIGYNSVVVKEKYIYGLYYGKASNNNSGRNDCKRSIIVLKHDGEPVARFYFDEHIMSIDIDETNGYIYGLAMDPNTLVKYKYEIP